MDDRTDLALYRIERDIRRTRDAEPCECYEPTSRLVALCKNCGWDHAPEEKPR